MKLTILYDNTTYRSDLTADWGFSAFVELKGAPKILFDTGANGEILLSNMQKMGIQSSSIQEIFISHDHWDHTGGLEDILRSIPNTPVYVPETFSTVLRAESRFVKVDEPTKLHDTVFSTGTLSGIEQSLVLGSDDGLVVLVGCSHPGVGKILETASSFGKVYALVGGLHNFNQFDVLEDLKVVCPTHCTKYKNEIKSLYPEKYVDGGAGKVLEL